MRRPLPSLMLGLACVAAAALASLGCATTDAAEREHTVESSRSLRWQLARAYIAKRAYVAAIPVLRQLVEETPDDPEVRVLHGTVLREQGLYAQAESEFRHAIRLAPELGSAHAGLGVLLDLDERNAEALEVHRRAVALLPNEATAWNNLGFSLFIAGRNQEAVEAFQRALHLDPSRTVAYNNLGFAYARLGDMAAARRSFRSAASDDAALERNVRLAREQHTPQKKKARPLGRKRSARPGKESKP